MVKYTRRRSGAARSKGKGKGGGRRHASTTAVFFLFGASTRWRLVNDLLPFSRIRWRMNNKVKIRPFAHGGRRMRAGVLVHHSSGAGAVVVVGVRYGGWVFCAGDVAFGFSDVMSGTLIVGFMRTGPIQVWISYRLKSVRKDSTSWIT